MYHGTDAVLNVTVACAAIHKTVSVVLLLGNMQFKQEKNSDQAVMPDDTGICITVLLSLRP